MPSGGGGAGFLQNAAGAVRVQPAAPAPYYQPAAGFRTYAAPIRANIVVVRAPAPVAAPVPPKRDDSTRMPVATVKAMEFIASAKKDSPYAPTGNVAREHFHLVNGFGGAVAGYRAGGAIGFYAGCAITGIPTGGAGCLVGAGIGYMAMSIVGAVGGFLASSYSKSFSEATNGLPDDYNLPRPK